MKKVSNLEGADLDYWVGRAQGIDPKRMSRSRYYVFLQTDPLADPLLATEPYSPSTQWARGGEIIDKMDFLLERTAVGNYWCSGPSIAEEWHNHPVGATGPTALIAAMRCYVMMVYGEEVLDD